MTSSALLLPVLSPPSWGPVARTSGSPSPVSPRPPLLSPCPFSLHSVLQLGRFSVALTFAPGTFSSAECHLPFSTSLEISTIITVFFSSKVCHLVPFNRFQFSGEIIFLFFSSVSPSFPGTYAYLFQVSWVMISMFASNVSLFHWLVFP